ncbi:DedA family protein [Methylococcus geothermalis]|uniref:DedA family protein n=1 Tax=Methylococcus geothermalis TaxID=2681310 RepID=A0A858Q5U3_9GAMM|nr:DedA family protein [Methylococcus geothermalis]QJD29232.1 DedA family protein [Methylococcus geothermalis]
MSFESLITEYGFPALIAGLLLEGETVLLIAGFLVGRGYFSFHHIVLLAFVVTLAADQGYFWLGYKHGDALLRRFPSLAPAVERASTLLHRYHSYFIFGFRFFYGLRVVTPILIGMSRFSPARYATVNVIAVGVWAVVTTGLGLVFGKAIAGMIDDLRQYESLLVGGLFIIGSGLALYRWRHIGDRNDVDHPPDS